MRAVERLGAGVLSLLRWRAFASVYLDQLYRAAVQSIPVVVFCLAFVAVLVVVELSLHMEIVLRQDSLVPAFTSVLMLRELGPVVTCLLLTSRIGAAMAAEIGMMKNTEQLDALQLLSVDRFEYLVLPRWVAGVFACVCLTVVAMATCFLCEVGIASFAIGWRPHEYAASMFLFLRSGDSMVCLVKAFVFGSILPIVAVREGFRCAPGSAGVGEAATAAVVKASILIIMADFAVSYLLQRL